MSLQFTSRRAAASLCLIPLLALGTLGCAADSSDSSTGGSSSGTIGGSKDPGKAGPCGSGVVPLAKDGAWKLQSPSPTPFSINSAWACSASDIWAAGDSGTIVHYDGKEWSRVESGTNQQFTRMWGTGGDDVWALGPTDEPAAVGVGNVFHYDGHAWSKETASGDTVWADGPKDVWIGGNVVSHFDGDAWQSERPNVVDEHGRKLDVSQLDMGWGSGPDDIWGLGSASNGLFFVHFDGTTWTAKDSVRPAIAEGFAMWGASSDDIWFGATGADDDPMAILIHWDSQAWREVNPPGGATEQQVYSLSGTSKDDVWMSDDGNVNGVGGRISHFDGTRWSFMMSAQEGSIQAIVSVSKNEAWAFNETSILHGVGNHWSAYSPTGIPTEAELDTIWANGPNDVWAFGADVYDDLLSVHWDGNAWSPVTITNADVEGLVWQAWGSAPNDTWALLSDGIYHYDGTHWSQSLKNGSIRSIWGSGPNDVYAVGSGDHNELLIFHWDGSQWGQIDNEFKGNPAAISGSGPHDIWIAGADLVLHGDGTTWTRVPADLDPKDINGIRLAVAGPDDAWIVGTKVLHWDGSSWNQHGVPSLGSTATHPVHDVRAAAANDVWFAGPDTALRHWDGHSLTAGNSFGQKLNFSGNAASAWAVGNNVVLQLP